MTRELDAQARIIFDKVLDAGMDQRQAILDAAYSGEPALRARVEVLLSGAECDDIFFSDPAIQHPAVVVPQEQPGILDRPIGKSVEVLQQIQSFVNEQLPTALGFGFSFAFRTLVVFHKGTAQFNQLPASWADTEGDRGQSLRDSWHEAEKGLRAAMAFVDRLGWSRKPLLASFATSHANMT